MGTETDEKPTPPTQPSLGGGDDADEHRDVRPPPVIVEPEQACGENTRGLVVQAAQVRGMGPLDLLGLASPGRPLNAGRDEEDRQPRGTQGRGHDTNVVRAPREASTY